MRSIHIQQVAHVDTPRHHVFTLFKPYTQLQLYSTPVLCKVCSGKVACLFSPILDCRRFFCILIKAG